MKWIPASARVRHHVLARLSGQERVEAELDRLVERVGRRARDDADRRTRSGPGAEDGRLAAARLAHAREELGGGDAVALERAAAADRAAAELAERLVALAAQPLGEDCVVADLRVGVERDVVGGERDSAPNSGRRRSASTGVSPVGWKSQNSPWWTSTSSAPSSTARSNSSRWAETPVTTRVDRGPGRGTCRPLGPRSLKAPGFEQLVEAETIEVIRAGCHEHAPCLDAGIGHLNARVSCLASGGAAGPRSTTGKRRRNSDVGRGST